MLAITAAAAAAQVPKVNVVGAEVLEGSEIACYGAEILVGGWEGGAFEDEEGGLGVDCAVEGGSSACLVCVIVGERQVSIFISGLDRLAFAKERLFKRAAIRHHAPWLSSRSSLNLGTRSSGFAILCEALFSSKQVTSDQDKCRAIASPRVRSLT